MKSLLLTTCLSLLAAGPALADAAPTLDSAPASHAGLKANGNKFQGFRVNGTKWQGSSAQGVTAAVEPALSGLRQGRVRVSGLR